MLRRIINHILFLPLALFINPTNVFSSETKENIEIILKENSNNTLISYEDIEKIILNNQELKSLQNLVPESLPNSLRVIAKNFVSESFAQLLLESMHFYLESLKNFVPESLPNSLKSCCQNFFESLQKFCFGVVLPKNKHKTGEELRGVLGVCRGHGPLKILPGGLR